MSGGIMEAGICMLPTAHLWSRDESLIERTELLIIVRWAERLFSEKNPDGLLLCECFSPEMTYKIFQRWLDWRNLEYGGKYKGVEIIVWEVFSSLKKWA